MPKYHVTLPDGQTYEVDSDHDLSDADVYAHATRAAGAGGASTGRDARGGSAPTGIVSSSEPDTWMGGFTKGLLGDKSLMTAAGTTAALALAPEVSLPALAIMGAMGGGAGAASARAVRDMTGGNDRDSIGSDVAGGAAEGATAALAGPALKGLGRAAGYVGEKLGPWGRHVVAGGIGLGTHSPAGVLASEVALNPQLAPRALETVGDAASVSTMKRTASDAAEWVRNKIADLMTPEPTPISRTAGRRALGFRDSTEVPYRAGGGVSDSYAAPGPRAGFDVPEPETETPLRLGRSGSDVGVMRQPRPADPVFGDVRGDLAKVAIGDDLRALYNESIRKGMNPKTAARIILEGSEGAMPTSLRVLQRAGR